VIAGLPGAITIERGAGPLVVAALALFTRPFTLMDIGEVK